MRVFDDENHPTRTLLVRLGLAVSVPAAILLTAAALVLLGMSFGSAISGDEGISYTDYANGRVVLDASDCREKLSVLDGDNGVKLGVLGCGPGGVSEKRIELYASADDGESWTSIAPLQFANGQDAHAWRNPATGLVNVDVEVESAAVCGGGVTYCVQTYEQADEGTLTEWNLRAQYDDAASPARIQHAGSWFMAYEDVVFPTLNVRMCKAATPHAFALPCPIIFAGVPGLEAVPDALFDNTLDGSVGLSMHRKMGSGGPYPCSLAFSTDADLLVWGVESPLLTDAYTSCVVRNGADGEVELYAWEIGAGRWWQYDGVEPSAPTPPVYTFTGPQTFDGVDDYVDTLCCDDFAEWTAYAVVNGDSAPDSSEASGPMYGEENCCTIVWQHQSPTFRGAAAVRVGGTWHAASFGTLLAGTDYSLAATYDGETLRAYKDGVLQTANGAPSGPPDAEPLTVKLGAHASLATFWAGRIDDARIWDRALSDAEIAALP